MTKTELAIQEILIRLTKIESKINTKKLSFREAVFILGIISIVVKDFI